jgi:hypothetical protein
MLGGYVGGLFLLFSFPFYAVFITYLVLPLFSLPSLYEILDHSAVFPTLPLVCLEFS